MPEKTYLSLLSQIWRIIKTLEKYDCIVGTTSGIAFALGFWKVAGFLSRPIVAIHCGLVNNPYNKIRHYITNKLLQSMHTVLYGDGEREPLLNMFPRINHKLTINQFGVDTNFWYPLTNGGNYILSIGNDGRRDYEILIDAAKSVPLPFKIITSLTLSQNMPDNIHLLRGKWHSEIITDEDIRSLYQKAMCVIIPLKESYQPSGQSVCLQAMACGCPVVLTKTKGLWSSSMMKNRQNVLFIKPHNREDLIDKINLLVNDEKLRNRLTKEGRKTVCECANSDTFARIIENCCLSVMDTEYNKH